VLGQRPADVSGVTECRSDTPGIVHLQEAAQDPQCPDQDHVGGEGHEGLEAGLGPVRLGEPARLDPFAEGGDEGVEIGLWIDRVNVTRNCACGLAGCVVQATFSRKAAAYSRPERGGGGR
jgi:hypothetical protein